jgi:Phosphorylase superfamily
MSNLLNIHAILVPQGVEYNAVRKGLSRPTAITPPVISIPVGIPAFTRFLQQWEGVVKLRTQSQPKVLIMGLCGSLTPSYQIGDIVLFQDCIYQEEGNIRSRQCDLDLINQLEFHLEKKVSRVKGLTCDRIISSASQKRHLSEIGADVVDMEGIAALDFFNSINVGIAMLRVVSDDSKHDLPNIDSALTPEGSLATLPLALGMLRQPIAAYRLINGSLRAIKILQHVATKLFEN